MTESAEAALVLEVVSAPGAPAIARRFAAEALRALGVAENVVAEVRLAVSEIISASVEAGSAGTLRVALDDRSAPSLTLPPLAASSGGDPVDRRAILEGLGRIRVEHLDGRTVVSVTNP